MTTRDFQEFTNTRKLCDSYNHVYKIYKGFKAMFLNFYIETALKRNRKSDKRLLKRSDVVIIRPSDRRIKLNSGRSDINRFPRRKKRYSESIVMTCHIRQQIQNKEPCKCLWTSEITSVLSLSVLSRDRK